MFAVLSPAKKLKEPSRQLPVTLPDLQTQIAELAQVMRGKSAQQLSDLMGISADLADLNHARYQTFELPFTAQNATPAALTFAGDTYVGFDASSLSDEDLEFAQGAVGILSGLYGLLRPLDLMQPYRLEMGTKLNVGAHKNLYQFWGDTITHQVNDRLRGHADPTLVNLASTEYFSAVKVKALDGPVLTPVFKELRQGKARVISFLAKKARGAMARYIVENRIDEASALRAFNVGGYQFHPELSSDTEYVFLRES